eukprot:3375223-Lingulodinium_polyedra.AAC.1
MCQLGPRRVDGIELLPEDGDKLKYHKLSSGKFRAFRLVPMDAADPGPLRTVQPVPQPGVIRGSS